MCHPALVLMKALRRSHDDPRPYLLFTEMTWMYYKFPSVTDTKELKGKDHFLFLFGSPTTLAQCLGYCGH